MAALDCAAELVLIAATTGEQGDIERATAQMERAQLVVTMPHGSYLLGETAAKQKMVRLVCDKCGRRGQYRIDRLLEQYGPDVAMTDLRGNLNGFRKVPDLFVGYELHPILPFCSSQSASTTDRIGQYASTIRTAIWLPTQRPGTVAKLLCGFLQLVFEWTLELRREVSKQVARFTFALESLTSNQCW